MAVPAPYSTGSCISNVDSDPRLVPTATAVIPYFGPNTRIDVMMTTFWTIPVRAGTVKSPSACSTPVTECVMTENTAMGKSITVSLTVRL